MWSDHAVTLCQLQILSAPPLPLCPLCLVAVSVHTTLYCGLCYSTLVDTVVGWLWIASTHDGNGNSTHPLSPKTLALRQRVPDCRDNDPTSPISVAKPEAK